MTRLDLVNRAITTVALVALAVTLGVLLARAPLTAAPAAPSVKIAPEPTLAPPSLPTMTPSVIEVPIEVEIAAAAEPKPESKPIYQPHRRGLFRRR